MYRPVGQVQANFKGGFVPIYMATSVPPPPEGRPVPSTAKTNTSLLIGAGIAGIVVVGGAVWLLTQR